MVKLFIGMMQLGISVPVVEELMSEIQPPQPRMTEQVE